jgi:hypothetical protein
MKLGSNDISAVKIGSTDVNKIYIGSTEVWTSFTGLLDTYTGASAAYSLRRLSSTYEGSAIEVRRASDNATQDIGFVNNELDTSTLATFCSGTNGFVTTWYDQSGNGNDATQTTAASQPKIYDSSSGVIEENGKPTLKFDGTNDFLSNTLSSIISQPTYWFVTHNFHATPSAFDGVIGNLITYPEHRLILSSSLNYGLQAGGSLQYNSYQASQSLISYKIEQSDTRFYFNGLEQTISSGTGIGSEQLESIVLGAINQTIGYSPIQFQEIILYPSDQSSNRSGIETNINDFYSIY